MNRSEMIARVRTAAHQARAQSNTSLPDWPEEAVRTLGHPRSAEPARLWQVFAEKFRAVHGLPLEGLGACAAWLREKNIPRGYLCPTLIGQMRDALAADGIQTETAFDPARIDDLAFGITRAAGLIAETGTVVLKDTLSGSRLGALAPWVHIAVADNQTVWHADLLEAIEDLGHDPCAIFVTGPSKTADVEGILIEGVHGPGVQICLRL